ncbi:MAG: hypothetical protein ABIH68_03565 [bacterium]
MKSVKKQGWKGTVDLPQSATVLLQIRHFHTKIILVCIIRNEGIFGESGIKEKWEEKSVASILQDGVSSMENGSLLFLAENTKQK